LKPEPYAVPGDLIVTGMVQAMSEVPIPGSIPHKDHIVAVELRELSGNASLLADASLQLHDPMWGELME